MKSYMPKWFNNLTQWKDSFAVAFTILAVVGTILAISEISLKDNFGIHCWITRSFVLLGLFFLLVVATFFIKYFQTKKGISLKIRGIKVNIQQGDIFNAKGWKIIAFNEFFDTTVDDIIIAHNTLNGVFIDKHIQNLSELRDKITNETDDNTNYKRFNKKDRNAYPLGRIITYKDFMLLAFTYFDNNQAHLTQKDYEDCLRVMWTEICRTYANKPIFIPLLGSGMTRFDGTPHKLNSDLLKCMLCTLRTSGANINQPITILLTEEVIQDINIYEIKGVK